MYTGAGLARQGVALTCRDALPGGWARATLCAMDAVDATRPGGCNGPTRRQLLAGVALAAIAPLLAACRATSSRPQTAQTPDLAPGIGAGPSDGTPPAATLAGTPPTVPAATAPGPPPAGAATP